MTNCPHCNEPIQSRVPICLACGEVIGDGATTDPWMGRLVAGRFRLESKLGDGGMGEVYKAVQTTMARTVALKILNDELAQKAGQVERFKREAQAASQLTHPNTIVVHDFGQCDDGTLFIAMEYLEGRPLASLLRNESPLSGERIIDILVQVCDSLQEAHDQQVVHRDLKPENIFITQRGDQKDYAKVLDFGIAKLTRAPDGQLVDRLTRAGTLCGTPHYMAPEQIRDETVDWRADIYALGVLLHYALAGREPFDAEKLVDVLTMHLHQPPPAIDWSDENRDPVRLKLEAVARQALEKDREKRPQSARALKTLLLACRPGGTMDVSQLAPSPAERTQRVAAAPSTIKERLFATTRRRRVTYAAIFLLLCILVGHFSEDASTSTEAPTRAKTTAESVQNEAVDSETQEPSERHSALVQDMMEQLKRENDLLKQRLTKLENSQQGEDGKTADDAPQSKAADSKTATE
ncbi:MAG: protein kinase domain-containing protein [Bradymonadia bacterium]